MKSITFYIILIGLAILIISQVYQAGDFSSVKPVKMIEDYKALLDSLGR